MSPSDHEAEKSRLFDDWVEDILADRLPRAVPASHELGSPEVAETLSLARWWAGRLSDSRAQLDAEAFADRLEPSLSAQLLQAARDAADVVTNSQDLATALRTIAARRNLNLNGFHRAVGLLPGVWDGLISHETPLHRVPVTTAARLLRALDIGTEAALDLAQRSCLRWAESRFDRPTTALGRAPADLDQETRGTLLGDDHGGGLGTEAEQIDHFIASLRGELSL